MEDDDRHHGPHALQAWALIADLLLLAGHESAAALRKIYREHTRRKVGATRRPGPETPLWNELARIAASQVGRSYGDKAALGRILGVPRQRVHDYLVTKQACPDAERVLELLVWLSGRLNSTERLPAPRRKPSRSHRTKDGGRPAIG